MTAQKLTIEEVAERIGRTDRTVRRYIKDKRLIPTHPEIGHKHTLLFDPEQVEQLKALLEQEKQLKKEETNTPDTSALIERLEHLEREVEYQDDVSDRVDALTHRMDEQAAKIAELQQLIQQLLERSERSERNKTPKKPHETNEDTIGATEQVAPNFWPTTRKKATVAQDDSKKTEELPADLVSASSFAKHHGIAESTVNKALATGRIPIVEGTWKSGKATVKKALNQEGREKFFALYRSNANFHECDDMECSCHVQEAVPEGYLPLIQFLDDHRINRNAGRQAIKKGLVHVENGDMLSPKGQREAWVQFHNEAGFRTCDQCPHTL